MLENISHTDRELEREIESLVGPSYSFIQSIKMGGTGSQRLVIEDYHSDFKPFLDLGQHTKKCNIEVRPKGIGLRFRYRLETMGWFISFEDLDIAMGENEVVVRERSSDYWLRLKASGRSKLKLAFFQELQNKSLA